VSRTLRALLCALALVIALPRALAAAPAPAPVAFVPLDDRPVTLQLPILLGDIAGRRVLTPPVTSLGHYLTPGDPDAILRWLVSDETRSASALVASLDMLAYGGLVASRVPGIPAYVAYTRLRRLAQLHAERPDLAIAAFGTIMRLAPTGVPATTPYWANGAVVDRIADYANLPSPPTTAADRERAANLRAQIGSQTLDAYLATRARNLDVDQFALQLAAEGTFGELVLGQDDAGPVGLHVADVAALNRTSRRFGLGSRASIEPGADELGMVLLARVFAQGIGWQPAVRVRYSRAGAAAVVDPLEYVPIDVTIGKLIRAAGGARTESDGADIDLFVRVPNTTATDDAAFADAIAADIAAGRSVAIADLTFLSGAPPAADQQSLVQTLIDRKLAGRVDAFASWNTDANTVGTALAAAIAVGTGRRTGRYDARSHAAFMLDRYADDYAFHQFVRPVLNDTLRGQGVDTTLLATASLDWAADHNRALLWPLTIDLLAKIYPEYHDWGLTITLPWERTFETQLDVRLGS
jgi:hypothetical protein